MSLTQSAIERDTRGEGEIVVDNHGTEWRSVVSFFVPGLPRPGGSKRGFFIPKLKRVIITDASKHAKTWKDTVAAFASQAWGNRAPLTGTLSIDFTFVLPRPKSHFRTGKHSAEMRGNAPALHASAPDATKLTRSTEDALTGLLWKDDALIAFQSIRKEYGDSPGARITLYELAEEDAMVSVSASPAGLFPEVKS